MAWGKLAAAAAVGAVAAMAGSIAPAAAVPATAARTAAVPATAVPATAVPAAAVPRRPAAIRPGAVASHRITVPPGRVKAFWTPRRLAGARPLPLPAARAAGGAAAPPAVGPSFTVPGTGPRGRGPAAAAGKYARVWASHGALPATSVGRLFFETPAGGASCSATVVRAPNGDTVWTAGHCVSDGAGGWYEDFLFQPDRHDGFAPFGSFTPKYVATTKGFFYQRNFRYDVAAMAMSGTGASLQGRTGAQGMKFGRNFTWRNVYDFGYAGDLSPPTVQVDADTLRYCTANTTRRPALGMMLFACNLGHGSSGGPLLWDLRRSRGWGYLVGNMSLARRGSFERLSPQFGAAAVNVYNAVRNR